MDRYYQHLGCQFRAVMNCTNVIPVEHLITIVKAGICTSRHTEGVHHAYYVAKYSVKFLFSIHICYRCMAFGLLNLEVLGLMMAVTEIIIMGNLKSLKLIFHYEYILHSVLKSTCYVSINSVSHLNKMKMHYSFSDDVSISTSVPFLVEY